MRYGVHLEPTTIVVTFSHAMDVALAESLASHRLDWLGDEGCGKRVVVSIPIRSAVYDSATVSVTLKPTRRLPLHDTFWLRIRGKPPGGLKDAWGVFLDGARNGHPGSNGALRIDDKLPGRRIGVSSFFEEK